MAFVVPKNDTSLVSFNRSFSNLFKCSLLCELEAIPIVPGEVVVVVDPEYVPRTYRRVCSGRREFTSAEVLRAHEVQKRSVSCKTSMHHLVPVPLSDKKMHHLVPVPLSRKKNTDPQPRNCVPSILQQVGKSWSLKKNMYISLSYVRCGLLPGSTYTHAAAGFGGCVLQCYPYKDHNHHNHHNLSILNVNYTNV
jgi:hypothetical protein